MKQIFLIVSLVAVAIALTLIYTYYPELFPHTSGRLTRVMSEVDGKQYYVRADTDDPREAANYLATIRQRLQELSTEYRTLQKRLPGTNLQENPLTQPGPTMTSYTINKGDSVVMCLRDPHTGKLHDLDTVLYVAIHEAAHIACPEVGHTPLFRQIFKRLLTVARAKGLLRRTDYRTRPMEYCGVTITERVI